MTKADKLSEVFSVITGGDQLAMPDAYYRVEIVVEGKVYDAFRVYEHQRTAAEGALGDAIVPEGVYEAIKDKCGILDRFVGIVASSAHIYPEWRVGAVTLVGPATVFKIPEKSS